MPARGIANRAVIRHILIKMFDQEGGPEHAVRPGQKREQKKHPRGAQPQQFAPVE